MRRWIGPALALGGVVALRKALRGRPEELAGKVAVITGSSRGLGLALAEEFARAGAKVVLCARSPKELEAARNRIDNLGAEGHSVLCDVGDERQARRLIEEATDRFGRVDILVNNAGIITVGPVEAQTLSDFEQSMSVMFWGVVHPTLAVLPQMRERGDGRIVNITSIGGKMSVPHLLPYNSAKFAAVGFSQGLAAEVAKDGISVTTIVPGLMRTGSHVNALFKGQHRKEFSWFSLAASLPVLTSIDARSAARQIVEATARREAELIITSQAQLAARLHGAFPGTTTRIVSLIGRYMPRAPESEADAPVRGAESETPITRSPLTLPGRRAAEKYQYGADQTVTRTTEMG